MQNIHINYYYFLKQKIYKSIFKLIVINNKIKKIHQDTSFCITLFYLLF